MKEPMQLPERVELCEVGPRDGFQLEDRFIPTRRKIEVIEALAEAGLRRIQVTSFVHPEWVPQMRDAEAVVAGLTERDDVAYTGLVLNEKGLERAHAAGLRHVDISLATSQQHSQDNVNMSLEEGLQQAEHMIEQARQEDLAVQLGFQTVFGYAEPGDIPLERVLGMIRRMSGKGLSSISLADTTGLAHPVMIQERVPLLQEAAGNVPIVLHLHDTRGLGLANVLAALQCGVARFDTSMAGMGGCPFIPGAAGNIATEDTAYMLEAMGIATGIAVPAVATLSRRMEAFLEKSFPGKMHCLLR